MSAQKIVKIDLPVMATVHYGHTGEFKIGENHNNSKKKKLLYIIIHNFMFCQMLL